MVRLTQRDQQRIVELKANGKSNREIAKTLNCSAMTIGRYLKKFGTTKAVLDGEKLDLAEAIDSIPALDHPKKISGPLDEHMVEVRAFTQLNNAGILYYEKFAYLVRSSRMDNAEDLVERLSEIISRVDQYTTALTAMLDG